jgi:hypothetical protein
VRHWDASDGQGIGELSGCDVMRCDMLVVEVFIAVCACLCVYACACTCTCVSLCVCVCVCVRMRVRVRGRESVFECAVHFRVRG